MKTALSRSIAAMTIVAFVLSQSACSSYMSARLPPSSNGPAYDDGRPELWVGAEVRVTCSDGSVAKGVVTRISKTELIVEKTGNFGVERQTIPTEEIEKVEVVGTDSQTSTVAAVFLVAGMVLVAAWIASWMVWAKSHPNS